MAAEEMEVTITLTPLGDDDGGNLRVIKLNSEKKEIEIGRASKNAHKCLLPASENAWFDYPILSRAHAKFVIHPPKEVLYIKDCKSTHGTFMGGRLDSGTEYAVDESKIISFGQPVTSGAVVYAAKEFRVHSKWENRFSLPIPAPFIHPPPAGFHVPDDFNDSTSGSSRESSIQLLESHPRTFSVPSTDAGSDSEDSDIESVEIASSIPAERGNDSIATTPEKGARMTTLRVVDLDEGSDSDMPQKKVRGLDLGNGKMLTKVSERVVTFEEMGIHATVPENEGQHTQQISDFESDGEGPEVLPFGITPLEDKNLWDEPELAPRQPSMAELNKEVDLDTEEQVKRIILETQARVAKEKDQDPTRRPSPEIHHGSVECSDDFDSGDDDGFDHDDFSDFGHDTADCFNKFMDEEVDKIAPAVRMPSDAEKVLETTRRESIIPKQAPSKPNLSNVPENYGIDPHKPTYAEYIPYRYPDVHAQDFPRAPSPSDAAMARTLADAPLAPTNVSNVFGNIHAGGPGVHDIPIDNSNSANHRVLNSVPFGYQYVHPVSYPGPTNVDTHSKPYDQGPFASRFAVVSTANPSYADPSTSIDRAGGQVPEQRDVFRHHPLSITHDVAADARLAAKLQAEEDALAAAPLAPKSHISELLNDQSRKSRKGSEGQSSKINISSLVNASHIENSRPLKRKSDEISTAATVGSEETHLEADWDTPRNPIVQEAKVDSSNWMSAEDTQLPDAQTRDDPPVEPASLTQDAEAVDSTLAVPETPAVEAEGPPRKKARTSSSPKGIGKFVSGVCVGLVGAFAAFVATIPPSVYEEALREFGNAT